MPPMSNDLDRVLAQSAHLMRQPEWFEDGDDEGDVSGPEGFPFRLAQSARPGARTFRSTMLRGSCRGPIPTLPGNDPLSLNTDPDRFLMLPKEREC